MHSVAVSSVLDPEVADQVTALLARATDADGAAPVSEQGVSAVHAAADGVAHVTAADADGDVVAYAQIQPGHEPHPPMIEAVVDPQARGRGVGTDLVREALAVGGRQSRVWAHGNLPAARSVAAKLGLSPQRELLQMRRQCAPLPELVVPEGISLGTYQGSGEDAEIVEVNADAFSWHPEQGAWTLRDVEYRTAESWFDPQGLFLARDANTAERQLLGFHWTKVHPAHGDEPALGEVYVVAVSPAAQGRGLGRVLTLAGLHYLQQRDLRTVLLYVEGDNEAALRTYERLGFTRFHTDIAYGASHSD
ncbi:MAG: mycothiol synthase [Rhodococcus sp.]|nr:mycothiol synthase [Rhodococcus sp. (in: high G+C Gram-positive bacteria)]